MGGADASFNVIDPQGGEPMRNPDVCLITDEQLEEMGGHLPLAGFWPVCPAFVVEVAPHATACEASRDAWAIGSASVRNSAGSSIPTTTTSGSTDPAGTPSSSTGPAVVPGEAPIEGFSFDFTPIWDLLDQAEAAEAADEVAGA